MATMHHLSVITNNCYKPPVNPENGLSASTNERTGLGLTSSRYYGESDDESDQENRHVVDVDNVNNSAVNGMLGNSQNLFNQTDSYMGNMTTDLAGLDDTEFYRRLTELKNEHKKTLELCEKMYQEKVGNAYSSNQTTPHSKTRNLSMNRSVDFDSDQDDTFHARNTSQTKKSTEDLSRSLDATNKSTDAKLDASFGKPPKPPTSHSRVASSKQTLRQSLEEPRSARSMTSAWTERSGEERFWKAMSGHSSEADHSGDETLRKSHDAKDYLHSARSPKGLYESGRYSATSQIEGMWDNFSIDDYAPRRSRARQRSNSMSKLSRSSSLDRRSDRALSVTSTDWKHRVTIPQPFNMTVRENYKERTRSKTQEEFEQKEREKRRREEEECQKKFKATPVPAHVYMPLYDEIMEQKEERRKEMREACMELTKSMEKPFKFVKREEEKKKQNRSRISSRAIAEMDKGKKKSFKAKPYPAHLFHNTTEDKMLEEEEYRKIRVQMRAEELLRKSQLPPNMAARGKDYTEGRYRSKAHAKKAKKSGFTDDYKFKPKINNDVPDFDELHRDFHREMAHRKMAREATVCKPFNLRTEKVVRKKHKQYEDFLEEEATLKENRWPYQSLRGKTMSSTLGKSMSSTLGNSTLSRSLDSIPTKMTASAHLRSTASKKKLQEAMEQELKDLEEERRRRLKEKQLRKFVAEKAAANDNTPSLKETNKLKVQEYRASERARLEEYRRQLNEMKERVESRPLLFERTSQESAARAAERRYKDTLRRAGLDEDFIAKKGSAATSAAASRHDDDDDDAASNDSYSYVSHSKKYSQSESKKYSDDFEDNDGLSDGDKTADGSDIEEDLPDDD